MIGERRAHGGRQPDAPAVTAQGSGETRGRLVQMGQVVPRQGDPSAPVKLVFHPGERRIDVGDRAAQVGVAGRAGGLVKRPAATHDQPPAGVTAKVAQERARVGDDLAMRENPRAQALR